MNLEVKERHTALWNETFVPLFVFVLIFFSFCVFPSNVSAQIDDEPPADAVPPPVRKLSEQEQKLLDAKTTDIKKRTQLSFELMDARLANSEKFFATNDFRESLDELGVFQGLLDNTLNFLVQNDNGNIGKNFKAFEIYLRKQIPRLESIRREMPYKYGYYVQRLMKAIRDARTKAIEPLFDDTVLPIKKP